MTLEEGYNEVKRDLAGVRAKAAHLTANNERKMRVGESRLFTYTSKSHNKWYILIHKQGIDRTGFTEFMEYTTGNRGVKGLLLLRKALSKPRSKDNWEDSVIFYELTPHLFERYSERFMETPDMSHTDFESVVRQFIKRNHHICASGNLFHSNVVHAFVRDGMLFGDNHISDENDKFTHIMFKTFVTTDQMSDAQRVEYERLWDSKLTKSDKENILVSKQRKLQE